MLSVLALIIIPHGSYHVNILRINDLKFGCSEACLLGFPMQELCLFIYIVIFYYFMLLELELKGCNLSFTYDHDILFFCFILFYFFYWCESRLMKVNYLPAIYKSHVRKIKESPIGD